MPHVCHASLSRICLSNRAHTRTLTILFRPGDWVLWKSRQQGWGVAAEYRAWQFLFIVWMQVRWH